MENAKIYVMLYAAHRMIESIKPALVAMKAGLEQSLPKSMLSGLTSRRRDCHFTDSPPFIRIAVLKRLLKVEGDAVK